MKNYSFESLYLFKESKANSKYKYISKYKNLDKNIALFPTDLFG